MYIVLCSFIVCSSQSHIINCSSLHTIPPTARSQQKVSFWYIWNHFPSLLQHYAMNTHTTATSAMKSGREENFFYHGWHHTLAECLRFSFPSAGCLVCTGKHSFYFFFFFWMRNRWKKITVCVVMGQSEGRRQIMMSWKPFFLRLPTSPPVSGVAHSYRHFEPSIMNLLAINVRNISLPPDKNRRRRHFASHRSCNLFTIATKSERWAREKTLR